MKKKALLTIVFAMVLVGTNAFGQGTYKFGHINSQDLLTAMPERDSAQVVLENYAQKLEDQLDVMNVEYNKKLQEYMAERDNLSQLIRETKEQDLTDMQQRIQRFSNTAQQDMQMKQGEVMQPIVEKAQNAIKEVAESNGYTYIFDLAGGAVLYFSDDSEDILPMVKAKLGIQ